jgi:acetylglutamate kinase
MSASGRRRGARAPLCVYKLGGPAVTDLELLRLFAREMRQRNERAVLVHGGGRQVEQRLAQLGISSRFVGGRRQTSPEAMAVVEMVLSGEVNKLLAASLTAAGTPAIGLSGRDAGLIRARRKPGLGEVGAPLRVDPRALRAAWQAGLLPVVSSVCFGARGEPLNVNADEAALGLATALRARRLVYLSDIDGVRVGETTAERLSLAVARRLIRNGTIAGGMTLKVRVALDAARAGIPEVVIGGRARLVGRFAGTRILLEEGTSARDGSRRKEVG